LQLHDDTSDDQGHYYTGGHDPHQHNATWFVVQHREAIDSTIHVSLLVCANSSLTYQAFSLGSPLILSVTSNQLPGLSNDVIISPSQQLILGESKIIIITINFQSKYPVMEIVVSTTKPVSSVSVSQLEQGPYTNASKLPSNNTSPSEYVAVTSSAAPTKKIIIKIVPSEATNVTSLTITACTGKFIRHRVSMHSKFDIVFFLFSNGNHT
jgi:hypothetical protein